MLPRVAVMIGLVLSPIVLCAGLIGVINLASGFRRSFGAGNAVSIGMIVALALVVPVHAGFAAAPFLLSAGRRGLAMWLTAPVAIPGTLVLGSMAMRVIADGAQAGAWVVPLLIGVALVGYIAPVVLLAVA